MRVRLAQRLDDDGLFELCAKNPTLRVERSADGELLIMPPTGGRTGRRNLSLSTQLGNWIERDGTGVGFDSSTGFLLPNGAERSPDAAWVRRERWDVLSEEEQEKFVPLCPDLVVELRSRTDDLAELQEKMREYMACGARLGWLIDPQSRSVYVYRPNRETEKLEDPATIAGDPELAGFVLDLRAVW